MKKVALPLARLSFSQKLDLMETRWADLSKDENKLESPAWPGVVLKEREAAYEPVSSSRRTGRIRRSALRRTLIRTDIRACSSW